MWRDQVGQYKDRTQMSTNKSNILWIVPVLCTFILTAGLVQAEPHLPLLPGEAALWFWLWVKLFYL